VVKAYEFGARNKSSEFERTLLNGKASKRHNNQAHPVHCLFFCALTPPEHHACVPELSCLWSVIEQQHWWQHASCATPACSSTGAHGQKTAGDMYGEAA
jgi:hypothetical protein